MGIGKHIRRTRRKPVPSLFYICIATLRNANERSFIYFYIAHALCALLFLYFLEYHLPPSALPVYRLPSTNFPLYFIVVYTPTRTQCFVSVLNYRTIIHFFCCGVRLYIRTFYNAAKHSHPKNTTPPTRLLLLFRTQYQYIDDSGMVVVILFSEWCSTSA